MQPTWPGTTLMRTRALTLWAAHLASHLAPLLAPAPPCSDRSDPHGEFSGRNVLIMQRAMEDVATEVRAGRAGGPRYNVLIMQRAMEEVASEVRAGGRGGGGPRRV